MSTLGTNTKLTPFDVLEIRKLRGEGWSQPQLAKRFKMSINQIGKICRGEAWMRVTEGQAVLTDGEAQLRQLTTPQPSQEEIAASLARVQGLLAAEAVASTAVPPQYQRLQSVDELGELVRRAEERRARSGEAPPAIPTRSPTTPQHHQSISTAEKLLETLKDEHATTNDDSTPK